MATATTTTSTIIALFESRAAAENAVTAMADAGYSREHVSIVTRDATGSTDVPDIGPRPEVGSGTDAGSGAAVGALAGFVGGIVALAIPGIGPILAAGPLAAGIMGAGIGAAAGGVIGALKEQGVPENDAARFSEAIRHGRAMLTAYVPSEKAEDVADFLDGHGAIDVNEPVAGVEPQREPNRIQPLTPEAVEAARLREGEGQMDRMRERERRTQIYPGFTGQGPTFTT
jgi:hypothetical protein